MAARPNQRSLLAVIQNASVSARLRFATTLRVNPLGAPLGSIVMAMLRDPSPAVRASALAAASQCDEPPIAALTHALDAHQPLELRRQAAGVFALLGNRAPGAIPKLIGLLADHDAPLRFQAALALGRQGSSAVPALLAALGTNGSGPGRSALFEALGWTGAPAPAAEPLIATELASASPQEAVTLHWAQARCGVAPSTSIASLVELTRHSSVDVRITALDKLMTLTESTDQWREAAATATSDSDPRVRATALRAASISGLPSPELGRLARRALDDGDTEVRAMGCLIFGSHELDCNDASDRLIQLHRDDSPRVAALARNASTRARNA